MKTKKTLPFMRYILLLFIISIILIFMLEDIVSFFNGFFAGWNGNDYHAASDEYGDLSLALAIAVLCIITFCFYRSIRNKVGKPVANLSQGMQEISNGNLSVRIPVTGSFEFAHMEENFNNMADNLESATKARQEQEQKNQQLYAGIAHDLKTPMTMVMGYARLLEREENIPPDARKRYLATIAEQTDHANKLLDSLLLVAKLGSNSYVLNRTENDIAECLRSCAANCYPMIEEANMSLELVIPDAALPFSFDEMAMKRVFTNLILNAVKHNPPQTKCLISVVRTNDEDDCSIRIIIADDGPKVPSQLRDRLFDSFAVGDESRNMRNGHGLGLAISKMIVERHGGTISYHEMWMDDMKAFEIKLV